MSSRPLLEAHPDPGEAVRLRWEIAGLEKELQEAKDEAETAKRSAADAVQAIRALRQQLEPLHKSLKMIFGEISRVDAETISHANENRTVNGGVWTERIARTSGGLGRILQVLLDGGGAMSLQQIRSAAKTAGSTSAFLSKLGAKNWVQKVGHGNYALKEV